MSPTYLVWRYNTEKQALAPQVVPLVVHADNPDEAAARFYGQALVVEAHVGDPEYRPILGGGTT